MKHNGITIKSGTILRTRDNMALIFIKGSLKELEDLDSFCCEIDDYEENFYSDACSGPQDEDIIEIYSPEKGKNSFAILDVEIDKRLRNADFWDRLLPHLDQLGYTLVWKAPQKFQLTMQQLRDFLDFDFEIVGE